MDKAFLEQMKKKVAQELIDREKSVVEYWKNEIEKILHKKPESIAALQEELRALAKRMQNRIQTLKKSSEL